MTAKPRRGIATISDIKVRCIVDGATHCWIWQGGTSGPKGLPAIHTFDHARGEKRVMPGPLAVWNIAHQAAPVMPFVYRACQCRLCLNPAHLREARTQTEIGLHIRRAGTRKGKNREQIIANSVRGRAAMGIVTVPDSIVQAIRAADARTTGNALAEMYQVSRSVVSRVRRGVGRFAEGAAA